MNRSGLLALSRGMRAYFQASGVAARVFVGWNARNRQDNSGPGGASRVVLIPGVFDAAVGAPRSLRAGRIAQDSVQNHVSGDPRLRELARWHQAITCSVWGVNPNFPNDEEQQIESTEALLEVTLQAIWNAVDPDTLTPVGFGNLSDFGDAAWTLPPGEMAFGRELTFGFVLEVALFDAPAGLAYPQPSVLRGSAA